MVNLAQRSIGNRKKGFANASDHLETWDDSDSITTVNARELLSRLMHKDSITTQHHNVKVLRPTVEQTEVVETELRVESTINVILID